MKTNRILIPVSIGELLDKITILTIKLEKINDTKKNSFVKREYDILERELRKLGIEKNSEVKELFSELLEVNRKLWVIEDSIRLNEGLGKFDSEFIELARSVYHNNDRRYMIKNSINKLTNSSIFEVKEYNQY